MNNLSELRNGEVNDKQPIENGFDKHCENIKFYSNITIGNCWS